MNIQDNKQDMHDLEVAAKLLSGTPFLIKLSNALGSTIEAGIKKLPKRAKEAIHDAAHKGLTKAAEYAGKTLDPEKQDASSKTHLLAAATTGAIGGFFGLAGVAIEVPATTLLIMRSILDIARSEGHDITKPEVQLDCLTIFSHGSPVSHDDDATDTTYYATRAALAETMTETAKSLSKLAAERAAEEAAKGLSSSTAGAWLAKLIDVIAARFGIVLTEKAALQAAPVLGAVTGATLNSLFMDFYQETAKGHFTVRRLEEKYGDAAIKLAFESILERRAYR